MSKALKWDEQHEALYLALKAARKQGVQPSRSPAPDPRGETEAETGANTEGGLEVDWMFVFFVAGMAIAVYHTFFSK